MRARIVFIYEFFSKKKIKTEEDREPRNALSFIANDITIPRLHAVRPVISHLTLNRRQVVSTSENSRTNFIHGSTIRYYAT